MEIKRQPFDTQLTMRGFFSVFEQYKGQGMSSEKAYELTEEYCIREKLSIKYSTFGSLKHAYYRFLNKNIHPDK